MTRWTTKVAESVDALVELEDWWNSREAAESIPFLHTATLSCWAAAFLNQSQRPRIQILYRDGLPVAGVTMFEGGGRLRSWPTEQADPFDVVADHDSDVVEYLPKWLSTWGTSHLYMLRESSPLVAIASRQPRWILERTRRAPYLDISEGMDVARARMGREHKRAIQRRGRRLQELGESSFVDHPPHDQVWEVLQKGLELEAEGWKGQSGDAALRVPSAEVYYRELAQVAEDRGWLRLSSLHLDGRMIAFMYDLVYGGKRHGMLSAYDESPEMSRLSPGSLLLDWVLDRSAEEGLTSYEFGRGARAWKRNWTDTDRILYDVSVYGSGLIGRSGYLARAIRGKTVAHAVD